MDNNPLRVPPSEIVTGGNEAVLNWYYAREQGSLINREAKIILFGNGNCGKTTLSHMLRKNEFVYLDDTGRTHGILIKKWIVYEDEFPENLREKIKNAVEKAKKEGLQDLQTPEALELHVWDFGGQEYYHHTHRLFMSSNVLYLLLWEEATNAHDDEKENYPVGYWQKNINHFSPNNITVHIQNKVEQKAANTDELHYKIACRQKDDERSIRRYEDDIAVLRTGILNQLANLSYIGEPFPAVYDTIRAVLRNEKRHFISYQDYRQICTGQDTTAKKIMQEASQQETLLQFLDDTGAVVCFRFRKGVETALLKDYVFTNPGWLTEVIYKILAKDVDEFTLGHVENAVSGYGLKAETWIEIMKQFELIFKIEKGETVKYVVPQYLPKECPNPEALELATEGKQMEHAFTLYYPDFLPKSNFLRLLSKYGRRNIRYLFWKTGLLFFLNKKTVFARCINTREERKIIIQVENNDAATVKEVFDALLEIDNAENLQVSVNEKDFVAVKKLKEKFANNLREIDSFQGGTLSVSEFERLLGKEQTTHITKTTTIKKEINIFVSYSSKDRDLKELLVEGLKNHLCHIPDFTFNFWSDKAIDTGGNWQKEIEDALAQSNAALLLVSSNFAASRFINETELAGFFERKKQGGYIIIPVLVRNYAFQRFEELSKLNFFKTYYKDYGFIKPIERNKFMPFDKLGDNANTTDEQLNDYYKNLSDAIYEAVKKA
ncbi:MAG: TIR domain-containing protein [Flavisolibacter sp.]|nr:TIR domain-containing protein [Flavisolibacter sp.]